MRRTPVIAWMVICCTVSSLMAAELEVGPGRKYAHPNDALADAKAGDTIRVWPNVVDGKPAAYAKVALYVDKPRIEIAGATDTEHPVVFSGKGYDYSGQGRTPRAIVQFNKGADGGSVFNIELTGASNGTHNGAGVRINQANEVEIVGCDIHHNDMGIMSNGDGTKNAARDQFISFCHIHHNGSKEDPGFNHNLYLGGAGVTVIDCDIHHAITGHNVKSRAHRTAIVGCTIHDSANREIDLVDADETKLPGSDAVVLFTTILKDPRCAGNKAAIHFGAEKGEHNGTLHLINCVVVTPFVSPVVELSAERASVKMFNCVVWNPSDQRNQVLFSVQRGAKLESIVAAGNWVSSSFSAKLPAGLAGRIGVIGEGAPHWADPENMNYRVADSPLPFADTPEPFKSGGIAIDREKLADQPPKATVQAWRATMADRTPIGLP